MKTAFVDQLFRLGVARDDQRIFGEQRQERIGGVVPRTLREREQALIEAGMPLLHFLRGAPAIHAHQRHHERRGNRRRRSRGTARIGRGSGRTGEKAPIMSDCHDDYGQNQRGARPRPRRRASRRTGGDDAPAGPDIAQGLQVDSCHFLVARRH